jgi:hypothetical protein
VTKDQKSAWPKSIFLSLGGSWSYATQPERAPDNPLVRELVTENDAGRLALEQVE